MKSVLLQTCLRRGFGRQALICSPVLPLLPPAYRSASREKHSVSDRGDHIGFCFMQGAVYILIVKRIQVWLSLSRILRYVIRLTVYPDILRAVLGMYDKL
jgi:hypothetical protein